MRGINKMTGKTLWIGDDGTTTYCTLVISLTADGRTAVLIGRGGHHNVPERPVGLSLIDLSPGNEGNDMALCGPYRCRCKPLGVPGSLAAPTWQVLYTLHWDTNYAYWFKLNPEEAHLVIDSRTGKLLKEQSLIHHVDYRQWNPAERKYIVHKDVELREMRELSLCSPLSPDEMMRLLPAWHCNIVLYGYHYFLTTVAHRRQEHAPKGRG